jgi:ABC-type multidrug transport system fused ATPase/permease subunit
MKNGFVNSRKQYQNFIRDNGPFFSQHKKNDRGNSKKKSLLSIVLRLLKEFKEQRFRFILVIILGICCKFTCAIFPWAGKYLIDTVFPQKSVMLLIASCAVLLGIGIIDVCLNYLRDYITNTANGKVLISIKRKMMKHLQKLSLIRIQELKVGGAVSRLQQDADMMSELMEVLASIFNACILIIIAISSICIISWKIAALCMILSLCIGAIGYFVFNIMLPYQKLLREDNSAISSFITEIFNGITIVKSFCKERTINREYVHGIGLLWRKTLYGNIISISVNRTTWFIYYLMQISIWLVGGYSIIKGNMTIGDIVAFIFFMPFIFNPILNIMSLFSQLQSSLACAARAFDLLDEETGMLDSKNTIVLKQIKKGIEFHNVTFDYPDGTLALKDVSVKIPKGKVTAIVGGSGGGKTTLINLILRFYKVTKGKITVDDIDINEQSLYHYRKMLSLVLQEAFLFDYTIKQNISFGNRKAKQEEIEKAAKIANCHEFIQNLEKKYDTVIGEKGVKLSGGQKQRIALARALLTNPQILILDEATSNLDSESEELIQIALKNISKNRTTIVIAHRLSTVLDADNIIVLEKGSIIEQGSYEELMIKNGRFAKMYNKQMKKEIQQKN